MFLKRARRRLCLAALSVAASCLMAPAASVAVERATSSIEEARQVLAITYFGPAPLYFTAQAVASVPLTVKEVSITTGDEYGATAFYEPFDGDDSNGQLWMARAPAEDPAASFGQGSCQGAAVTGPWQLGPYSAFFARCDISFIYRFLWQGRLYAVASKYYGGLTPEQLAPIVAAMTPVAADARPLPSKVVLGSASYAGPYGSGWGKEPSVIFNGGVPSGLARDIRWTKWGAPVGYGRGRIAIYKPRGGYYRKLAAIELRASRLGTCPGEGGWPAYTRLQARVPSAPAASSASGSRGAAARPSASPASGRQGPTPACNAIRLGATAALANDRLQRQAECRARGLIRAAPGAGQARPACFSA